MNELLGRHRRYIFNSNILSYHPKCIALNRYHYIKSERIREKHILNSCLERKVVDNFDIILILFQIYLNLIIYNIVTFRLSKKTSSNIKKMRWKTKRKWMKNRTDWIYISDQFDSDTENKTVIMTGQIITFSVSVSN